MESSEVINKQILMLSNNFLSVYERLESTLSVCDYDDHVEFYYYSTIHDSKIFRFSLNFHNITSDPDIIDLFLETSKGIILIIDFSDMSTVKFLLQNFNGTHLFENSNIILIGHSNRTELDMIEHKYRDIIEKINPMKFIPVTDFDSIDIREVIEMTIFN